MTPPDPDHPVVLSVADILRREGLRGPHVAAGPLRPRGHAGPPVPTLSAPRPPGHGRATVAVAALAVAGAVLGATAVHDAAPGRTDPGNGEGATGVAEGRAPGADTGTAPAAAPSDLVALATGLTGPVATGDGPGGGVGGGTVTGADLAGLSTVGREPQAAAPAPGPGDGAPVPGVPDDGSGDDAPRNGASGDDGSGDDGSGDDPPGDDPPGDDAPADRPRDDPPADGGPGNGTGGPVAVVLPEVRAPAAAPGAPAVRPGAVSVAPDALTVTGPAATTEAERLGPVGVGAAAVRALELELSAADGPSVRLAEAEVGTPALEVAGTGLDLPDLATPAVELGLPLG